MSFLAELKRRNVFKVAATYVIVGWLIMQVGEVMAPALRLPDWVLSALAFFLVLGFPVALVLTWALELTPEGIRLDRNVAQSTSTPRLTGRKLDFAIIVLLVLASGFLAFDRYVLQPHREAERVNAAVQSARDDAADASAVEPSLAVLAFKDMSPGQDQQYLSDGLAEELLNALAQVPGLKVISRTSAFSYKGRNLTLSQVAEELHVAHVLEGSVRKSGNRVRITTQLIDARSDTHVWSETYDRTLDDIFAVQQDVARRVAASLLATLTPQVRQRISRRPTDDLAAYDLYLRGRAAYREPSAENNSEAIRLYEQAIKLDPDYALAWAGLADAYAQRDGRFGYPHGSSAPAAIEYANRALAIDPELAEAHRALAFAKLSQGKTEEARLAYLTAVEINPNFYEVWRRLGYIHMVSGRYDESVWAEERAARLAPKETGPLEYLAHDYKFLSLDQATVAVMRRILALDPDNVIARLLKPQLAVYHSETAEALREAERIVTDLPDVAYAWVGAASMAYMSRDFGKAVAWAREGLRIEPDNNLGYWHHNDVLLALSLHLSGSRREGDVLLGKAIETYSDRVQKGERDWSLRWDIAAMHAARGERDEAMHWFERAYVEDSFRFARWPPIDPAFDAFREDPRYRALMTKMTSEVEAMRARVVAANPALQ